MRHCETRRHVSTIDACQTVGIVNHDGVSAALRDVRHVHEPLVERHTNTVRRRLVVVREHVHLRHAEHVHPPRRAIAALRGDEQARVSANGDVRILRKPDDLDAREVEGIVRRDVAAARGRPDVRYEAEAERDGDIVRERADRAQEAGRTERGEFLARRHEVHSGDGVDVARRPCKREERAVVLRGHGVERSVGRAHTAAPPKLADGPLDEPDQLAWRPVRYPELAVANVHREIHGVRRRAQADGRGGVGLQRVDDCDGAGLAVGREHVGELEVIVVGDGAWEIWWFGGSVEGMWHGGSFCFDESWGSRKIRRWLHSLNRLAT